MSSDRRRDGTAAVVPQPARGYSWEPFEEGNTVAVKHGAYSDRIISSAAEEIRQAMLERGATFFADDTFMASVERYCRAEARSLLLHNYVMEKADADGVPSVPASLWQAADRAEANAAKFGQDCGLDARGRAAIARDLGLAHSIRQQTTDRNVQALVERGAELRKKRLKEIGENG